MATKKKTPQPVEVEFHEIMNTEPTQIESNQPVEIQFDDLEKKPGGYQIVDPYDIKFKYETKKEEDFVSKWAKFIDEDGTKILLDLRSIKRIEEVPEAEISEMFNKEELEEQPLWNKALSIYFYDEEEPDPEEVGFYYGKSFDELKDLLERYERSIKR
jgi:hypothetical protein